MMTPKQFYYDYEMPLARAFYNINQRGVLTDPVKMRELRSYVVGELEDCCHRISVSLGGQQVIPANPAVASGKKGKQPVGSINLSSPDQLAAALKKLGLKIPIKRGRGTETTDEEAINDMYAETGNPVLKEILRVRELNKVLSTYIDIEFENNILYSAYFVTGTVTGRRSSRANYLGLGTNGQNLPKHSDLSTRYRECVIARPGRIFLSADQIQAEDWAVQGIIADQSGDTHGLDELKAGIDRHKKLASFIFSKPEDQCGKDTPERYMGKKVRHAGNYDMRAFQFSVVLAKEGFRVPVPHCEYLLEKFHSYDPGIRGVFHQYVQSELITKRTLTTPLGRVRQFFSLRDYSDNSKIFKEAYAQIPQSTVGDNTGLSILWLESHHPGYVVMDGHDAVYLEVPDTFEGVRSGVDWIQQSFVRDIVFPNGLTINIPIEFEIGYSLGTMKKCGNLSEAGLRNTYSSLSRPQNRQDNTTIGQQQLSSEPRSSVIVG